MTKDKTLFDKVKDYCQEESDKENGEEETKSSIIFKRGGKDCKSKDEAKLIKK